MAIELKIGDARQLIKTEPDKKFDCVMTSPPYWGLRDYGTEPIIFDGAVECKHVWGEDIVEKQSGGTNNKIGNNCDDRIHYESKTNFCSLCGAWKGQLGLEPTPELYLYHLWQLFDDIKLKLKDTGNCFVNLGDTYGTQSGTMGAGKMGGGSHRLKYDWLDKPMLKGTSLSVKHKCLCMIPQRFAWGMIERGWILRNEIVWHKSNHMPESVTDRLTKSHEVIWHFVKQQKYYYDLDAIREHIKTETIGRYQRSVNLGANAVQGKILQRGEQNTGVPRMAPKWFREGQNPESFGSPRARTKRTKFDDDGNKNANGLTDRLDYYRNNGLAEGHPNGKNPGDVWQINTRPYPEAHFAVFPIELVRKPILAGCPVDGYVLDPFGGSGTVAEFCRKNERNCTIYELNPDYKTLIEDKALLKTPTLFSYDEVVCNAV